MREYAIHCIRSGDWWAVEVPEVPSVHTQARRLDQVEAMARDAIALLLDVPEDSFRVTITDVSLTPGQETTDVELELAQLRKARLAAEEVQSEVTTLSRDVATRLVDRCGLTVRDAGRLMGLSHQRVAQLIKQR